MPWAGPIPTTPSTHSEKEAAVVSRAPLPLPQPQSRIASDTPIPDPEYALFHIAVLCVELVYAH